EWQRVDHFAYQAVAAAVAGIDDLDLEHRRRVLLPEIVAVEQRPQAGGSEGQLDRILVVAHVRARTARRRPFDRLRYGARPTSRLCTPCDRKGRGSCACAARR